MNDSGAAKTQTSYALNPLGAGDVIDRAVRLYRKNFFTFVKIAVPSVIITAIGSVMVTVGWREAAATGKNLSAFVYVLLLMAGFVISLCGNLSILMVMGGASRNLVRHLLWNEPITAKETFRNTKSRFWSLLFASLLVSLILFVSLWVVYFVLALGVLLAAAIGGGIATQLQVVGAIVGILIGIAAILGALWLFLFFASRFAYIPQAIMVEGQGIGSAFARSFDLASGNVKRFSALVIFTLFASYSALMILFVPLGWYGYLNGIEIVSFDPDATPIWYSIVSQLISQASLILISPILMLGLSVLYVDERVRKEGYDIELAAARNLGEIPALPQNYSNPLQPALANQRQKDVSVLPPPTNNSSITTLELR